MIMEERYCLACQEVLIGRADKKFCDDQCRNNYNNKLNANSINIVRSINYTLRKNRRILASLAPEGKKKFKKAKLLSSGYDLKYHTHTYQTKEGAVYYFCYEYGYLEVEDNLVLIVKNDRE